MKKSATKLPPGLAGRMQKTAEKQKQTVSSFLHTVAENEVNGSKDTTFGERFGHGAGVVKGGRGMHRPRRGMSTAPGDR